jgi:cyclic pyranopterin phosphate synthase
MELVDSFGREITYLRIGVTDRCNLRCRYCMPEEGIDFSKRTDLLMYEEIVRLAQSFYNLGVKKVRLTGGEPFVRKDIDTLIRALTEIFPAVHITTNATLLHNYIEFLKEVNIAGLNVSLDTLERNKFQMITRRDNFDLVLDNLHAANDAGINVKVNVVVMKGINDNELCDFVELARNTKTQVRFIETMPFNEFDGNQGLFMPASEILEKIKSTYPNISIVQDNTKSSSVKYLIDGEVQVGIIPAYSRSLCGSCNRIRLTPKGELLTCLYAVEGIHLLPFLRDKNISDEEITSMIKELVWHKKVDGFKEEKEQNGKVFRSMTTIGG